MRRRLGVSPGPVALNGPLMVTASNRGTPSESTGSSVDRYGCSSVGGSALVFWTKVTPIACGPAFIGTRTCIRASMIFTALSGPISDVW